MADLLVNREFMQLFTIIAGGALLIIMGGGAFSLLQGALATLRKSELAVREIPNRFPGNPFQNNLPNLGYDYLTTVEVVSKEAKKPFHIDLYTSISRLTIVEVSYPSFDTSSIVQFGSFFHDNSVVATRYPLGENIDTSQFNSHFATDLTKAHKYHRRLLAQKIVQSKQPYRSKTFIDFQRNEAIYRPVSSIA